MLDVHHSSKMKYVYEASVIFVEVANNIYKIGKDKHGIYDRQLYYNVDHAIEALNNTNYRVAICKDSLETIIHANFEVDLENIVFKKLREKSQRG